MVCTETLQDHSVNGYLLQQFAKDAPEDRFTREAKSALERLAKRRSASP